MSQNIYDDEGFFAGYSQLPRSVRGLEGAPEWAALRSMLPEMRGLRVLDLGCGFGWFSRWAAEAGAASVLGIDLSEKMLERAQAETESPVVTYERADLEELSLTARSFDLVYSSLVFHYIRDLAGLLGKVRDSLVSGGTLLFSVEHPLFTAPSRMQWLTDPDGRLVWPVDSYLVEGERIREWLAPGVIKQHRTFGTYVNTLVGAGFVVSRVVEWGPTDEQIEADVSLAEERDRPTFMLVKAELPAR
jgi:2-polyprenyl-3-methyl-5-hydroxy-6-metoxy-1,4-benzoquinol methylase